MTGSQHSVLAVATNDSCDNMGFTMLVVWCT